MKYHRSVGGFIGTSQRAFLFYFQRKLKIFRLPDNQLWEPYFIPQDERVLQVQTYQNRIICFIS